MKSKKLVVLFVSSLALAIPFAVNASIESRKEVEAATLPANLCLTDTSESNIRSFYSDLNGKNYYGTSLLQHLKSSIKKNHVGYSYSDVTKIYKITDRNWKYSKASEMSGYRVDDQGKEYVDSYSYTDENPYIFHYYVDREYQDNHPIKHKEDGATRVSFDKEHIWPKSHGFPPGSGKDPNPYAGTDLHHLVAANPDVNQQPHNNRSYGNVASNNWTPTQSYLSGNKRGAPKVAHSGDEEGDAFEPQDSDKGDFARALLYMVARYNYFGDSSTPTVAEPNLELVNRVISESFDCSTTTSPAPYGIISDLLEWHKMDPVDDYEIHRNNLIYENYQHTRNPFIDFPGWVDLIWNSDGSYVTSSATGANPQSDPVYEQETFDVINIEITKQPNKTTYNLGEDLDLTGMEITATCKNESGEYFQKVITNGYTHSAFNNNKPGEQNIYIEYGTCSAVLIVTVTNKRWVVTGTYSAKYTIKSTSCVVAEDETQVPTGSVASFNNTYTEKNQLTSGNSATLSLSNYSNAMIKSVVLEMHSNTSKGAGSFSIQNGNASIESFGPASFDGWYDSTGFTTENVNITCYPTNSNYIVDGSTDLTFTISATDNSLYIYSYTINYEVGEYVEDDDPYLTSFKITAEPTKLTYYQGETLDTTGIVITGVYSDSSEKVITEGLNYSPTVLVNVGTQTIVVTHEELTIEKTFTVTVLGNILDKDYELPTYSLVTNVSDLSDGDMFMLKGEDSTINYFASTYDNSSYLLSTTGTETTSGIFTVSNGLEMVLSEQDSVNSIWKIITLEGTLALNTSGDLKMNETTNNLWKISYDSSLSTLSIVSQTSGAKKNKLLFNQTTGMLKFKGYGNITTGQISKSFIYKRTTPYSAFDFARDFLKYETCDSTPDENQWNRLKAKYQLIQDKSYLTGGQKDAGGNWPGGDERSNRDFIGACLSRYELIVKKYGYDNFIGRDVDPAQPIINKNLINTSIIVISVTAVISLSFLAVVIYKKKKEK